MVRLINRETGSVVVVDEETAQRLGPEWTAPAETPPAPKKRQKR